MKLFAIILLVSVSIATGLTWFVAQEDLEHPMDFWKVDDQGNWTGEWDYSYAARLFGFYWLIFFSLCFFLGAGPLLMCHGLPLVEQIVTKWSRRTRILITVIGGLMSLAIFWSIGSWR